jgi:hypothetical protein
MSDRGECLYKDDILHVGKGGMKKNQNNGSGGFSPFLHF